MIKAIIIAHYHSQGLVRDDTLELLQQLNKYFQKIIFVSTHLQEAENISFRQMLKFLSGTILAMTFILID